MTSPSPPSPRTFRDRARLEAERYGADPWVFVRELLQNARDAGATTVQLVVEEDPGAARVHCRDDGEGMTFDHARRYLFSLYASSKEGDGNQAGQFGVGFWSVLRFDPASITIGSRPRAGDAWALQLDGQLEHAVRVEPPAAFGTHVTLERAVSDGMLTRRVADAAVQNARFLRTRDDPSRMLDVTVNGQRINAPFELGAPSASFRRGRVRGVVGLGPAPRVELFSRGLRVRSAASLDDLLAATGHTDRSRVRFSELPGGIAPVAILESDDLEVMLARSDARDTRPLRRLVKLASRELTNLVERQLSLARPLPWYLRPFEPIARAFRNSLALRTASSAVVGALGALAIAWWWWGEIPGLRDVPAAPLAVTAPLDRPGDGPLPYSDLRHRYGGPKVDVLEPGDMEPVALAYAPPEARPRFAALLFDRLADDGSPVAPPTAAPTPYATATCESDCIMVELGIVADAGPMRLPVPTGHRVVVDSVELDGVAVPVLATHANQPIVVLEGATRGVLRYGTAPAADPTEPRRPEGGAPLPDGLLLATRDLRDRPTQQIVTTLVARVRELVAYDRSRPVSQLHEAARGRGTPFIQRTLEIGKGDCDVQNGLLVALLHEAGVPARLAVGYLGLGGRVAPWLHAWVEYYDGDDGHWRIADASDPSRAPTFSTDWGDAAPVGPPASDAEAVPVDTGSPLAADASGPAPPEPDPAAGSTPHPALGSTGSSDVDGPVVGAVEPQQPPWLHALWALPFVAGVVLVLRRRTRRSLSLDDTRDLSQLLAGALQQPAVFRKLPALFHRPLVPVLGGGAISLNRARELSLAGKLFRTRTRSALARRSRRRATVLDAREPEARTVADAFSAVDLDRWDALLSRSSTNALLDAVNATLRNAGEEWVVRATPDLAEGIMALNVAALRTPVAGLRGGRVVVVDQHRPWFVELSQRFASAPQTTVFAVLDRVAERIGLPDRDRASLLAAGARGALREVTS